MNIDECYELGYVVKTHGLDGTVTVKLDVDFPEAYGDLESVFVEINKQLIPYFVDFIQIAKGKANIKFEDVDTIEQAEALKGCKLFLPLDVLPDLEEDQFYYHEITGYQVLDVNLGALGVIQHVYEMPGQDLMAMDFKGKEVLIPVSDDIIRKVDRQEKMLHVELPEGLLDIYMEE
jgi:16S rRNA processing protein RimM